jgi:hypothetical protein
LAQAGIRGLGWHGRPCFYCAGFLYERRDWSGV